MPALIPPSLRNVYTLLAGLHNAGRG